MIFIDFVSIQLRKTWKRKNIKNKVTNKINNHCKKLRTDRAKVSSNQQKKGKKACLLTTWILRSSNPCRRKLLDERRKGSCCGTDGRLPSKSAKTKRPEADDNRLILENSSVGTVREQGKRVEISTAVRIDERVTRE